MEKGKKKLFVISGIFMTVLLVMAVFAAASGSVSANEEQIKQVVSEKKDDSLSADISSYVGDFVEKRGISPESINNISEVTFEDLPKEVNIENVDDTNLAIYRIDYDKTEQEQDKIFVITYSVEKLRSQGDLIISHDKREFLNFGFNGEMTKEGFLRTASGIESNPEKGYVMMRAGSITGISTNLEVLEGNGNLEIVIYKNGEKINFGNSFAVELGGIEKDYDVQSKDTVTFEAGDVISVYARASEGIKWKDVITLLEITTN